MKHEPKHPFRREMRQGRSNPAGPLPAEFDRRLVEVDEKLARRAASQTPRIGLTDRVFRASVSHLPAQQDHSPLRFPRTVRTPVWGQLAMAASVAVAFVVAAWFHSAVTTPTGTDGLVHHTPPPAVESMPLADDQAASAPPSAPQMLSPEVEHLLFDGESDYLLNTRDLSHADAVDDLHRIYEQLSEL